MEEKCTNCFGESIVEDRECGNRVCTECGCVAESCMIDDGPEWINGGEGGQQDGSRCGPSSTNDLIQASTIILDTKGASRGVRSIQKYHQQLGMDHKQRALYGVFKTITTVCESSGLQLPDVVIFQAKELYKDLKELRISRGGVHKALIATCVYYACKIQRQEGLTRSKLDIAYAFEVPEKAMSSACKLFKDVTRGRPYHDALYDTMETTDLVHRVVGSFGFQRDVRIQVMRSVRQLDDSIRASGMMDGKSPSSVLAAILCIVFQKLKLDISKDDITMRCQTTVVTLNKMLALLVV